MSAPLAPIACCAPLAAPVISDVELATAAEPVCACELIEPLGLGQPTVSHHLKKLTDAGLLEREQRGRWAHFSLNPDALRTLAAVTDPEGSVLLMTTRTDELREEVRRRYAESARAVAESSGGCGSGSCCVDGESVAPRFGVSTRPCARTRPTAS